MKRGDCKRTGADSLDDRGGDGLARAAPGRKGVEDDNGVAGNELLEAGGAAQGHGTVSKSATRLLFSS